MAFEPTPARELAERTRKGDVTLVLGAGVSRSVGLPDWKELARRAWARAFPDEETPWDVDPELSPASNPQFLPIVFERIYAKLDRDAFTRCLRDSLYAEFGGLERARIQSSDASLAVVARTLLQEYRAKERGRIERVVTLNVDDLVERAVERLHGGSTSPLKPISTPMGSPDLGGRAIPVYHLHGYIPHDVKLLGLQLRGDERVDQLRQHMQVFTDAQYWRSASSIQSFANRTMGAALEDSHCVFLGMSMTDINILRWLALRYDEIVRTALIQDEVFEETARPFLQSAGGRLLHKGLAGLRKTNLRRHLQQHYWIRPQSDDPTGFLSEFLALRGVLSVEIPGWDGPGFARVMRQCFPPPKPPPRSSRKVRGRKKAGG